MSSSRFLIMFASWFWRKFSIAAHPVKLGRTWPYNTMSNNLQLRLKTRTTISGTGSNAGWSLIPPRSKYLGEGQILRGELSVEK